MNRPAASLVLAAAVLAAASGCRFEDGGADDGPAAPTAAQITITVSPSPLRLLVVCPPSSAQCFGSLDAVVTLAETGGVGGRVEHVDLGLYDVPTARLTSSIRLGPDWLRQQAGTDRIEAGARLALRPVVQGYPFPAGTRPHVEVVLEVQFVDDRGNTIRQQGRYPVE